MVSAELRRSARTAPDPTASAHALMETLTHAAERQSTMLVLDEVADAVGVSNVLELARSHLQGSYRTMGVAFAGSKPTMMTRLFADVDQPFYSQAQRIELGPLESGSVVDIVSSGFHESGRHAGPIAAAVAEFGRGHPQRSMELADAAWWLTAPGAEATAETWSEALADVRSRSAPALRDVFSQLSGSQQAVLRSVVRSGAPFAASEGRFHDLSNSSRTAARDALLDRGVLAQDENGTRVVDPLLADWTARELP